MNKWIRRWLPDNAGRYVVVRQKGFLSIGVVQLGNADLVRGQVLIRLMDVKGQFVDSVVFTEEKAKTTRYQILKTVSGIDLESNTTGKVCSLLYAKFRRFNDDPVA